ncbi:unnamed protein product [Vicia faba]|uniref:Uncharacterized protein n=1 Tax=Vicia faba TaxID=3906 RepID=A0AAV0ZHR5_VICFA|nr:unnamed protein product [Vicia faba]
MGGQQKKISQRARNQVMGFKVSHKPVGFDLMQNCDLPPPSKVFLGSDKTVILSMNKVCNISGKEKEQDSKHCGLENGDDEKDKRELLKALKASQTRAREAEKMAAILNKEKDDLSVALLEEAMQLFACRQRVRLLELQVLNLQQKPAMLMPAEEAIGLPHEETVSVSWVLALIFSLGIGVATALAWGY